MTYLLDTNTCIRYLNGTATGVLPQMKSHSPSEIVVCSIVKAELFYGAFKSSDPVRRLSRQRSRAHLVRQGTPIGPNDCLIAAIALTNNATLVTSNTREFSRVPGLALSDWETS